MSNHQANILEMPSICQVNSQEINATTDEPTRGVNVGGGGGYVIVGLKIDYTRSENINNLYCINNIV